MSDDQPTSATTSLRRRIRYRFDLLLSRGMWAVLLWLGVLTIGVVILSSLLLVASGVSFSGSEDGSWIEDFWQSLLRIIDPGTMAGDVGWGRRILALVVTFVGLLLAGTLIGLIATAVELRVEQMRTGRSAVTEAGHVVILGASDRLPIVIEQLVLAHPDVRTDTIAVLADRDAAEVQDEVRSSLTDLRGRRLVFRTGSPARVQDLEIVAVSRARAVVVLADEETGGDAEVVKAVLAAGTRLGGFDKVPIIAELTDPVTAETLDRACGGDVHPIVGLQTVARTSVLALRRPGLKEIVQELLDYRGSDVCLVDRTDVLGRSFGDVETMFAEARPIGRVRPDGDVELNPDRTTIFESGDRLVVVAEDGHRLELATHEFDGVDAPELPTLDLQPVRRVEHLLIIGWNKLGRQLIQQWEPFAAPGSTVEIVYDARLFDAEDLDIASVGDLDITLTPTRQPTWHPDDAEHASHFTSIVVLGYRRETTAGDADSRTLLHLLLLRHEFEEWGLPMPRLLAEMRDVENVSIAGMSGPDDFVVSDAISSRFIAQLAEQPNRRAVFRALYEPGAASLHLVDATELDLSGREVTWAEAVVAGQSSGVVVIGYRRAAPGHQVVLTPNAADRVSLVEDDQLVVIG